MAFDKVFIISAPSGTGKTTLNRMLLEKYPDDIEISVSHTTRPKRPDEIEGKDYYFVSESQLRKKIQNNEMLESAEVHGKLYGTSLDELRRILSSGKIAILEIDVQGWEQAKPKLSQATSIFILPPDLKNLWQRLEARGTDSLQARWQRLQNAYNEIKKAHNYDFFIVNHNLEEALTELENIVIKAKNGKIPKDIGKKLALKLVDEYQHAPWIAELKKQTS